MLKGIITWGKSIADILSEALFCKEQLIATEGPALVSILLEGPRKSGKTALAAQIAKNTNFPFIKICTSEDMIGFTEPAKCSAVEKVVFLEN